MGLMSFVGRFLFVTIFVLAAHQEFSQFGLDVGPTAKVLSPKVNVFANKVTSLTGFQVPHIEMKHLVLVSLVLRGLGSFLFVFGSASGAFLLLIQLAISIFCHDYRNYDGNKEESAQLFFKFTQELALAGALLFFLGLKNSLSRRSAKKKAPKTKAN